MKNRLLRILVADDEDDFAYILARFMERRGREVQVAYDGFESAPARP